MCRSCRLQLRVVAPPRCARCGAPTAWPVERCRECAGRRLSFASARAAVVYAGPARSLVHGWKELGLRRAAGLAAELVVAHVERSAADVIAYIPPDPHRQLQRGHPPRRAARTRARQALVARGARAPCANAPGRPPEPASIAPPDGRTSATVLLVDDVYTTGATVGAAATALRSAGAACVHVVTFARTVR
jgi:predicted amidophosphoribosyltransferase